MTLGDDGDTGSLSVDLLPLGDGETDVLKRGMLDLVGLSEALGLVLVAEHVVGMLKDRVYLLGVELDQETGGEVVAEGLVVLCGETSVVDQGVIVRGDEEG